jgi:hypothetical protein
MQDAYEALGRGEVGPLIAYLRHPLPIGEFMQEEIARRIEGTAQGLLYRFDYKKTRPGPGTEMDERLKEFNNLALISFIKDRVAAGMSKKRAVSEAMEEFKMGRTAILDELARAKSG